MRVRTSPIRQVAVAGLLLAMISGCTGRSQGLVLPAGPTPTTPTATSPTAISPTAISPTATTNPPVLTLSDRGYGRLSLGMSKAEAVRTGLVGKKVTDGGSDVCTQYRGRGAIEYVYIQKGWVSIIIPSKAVKLDTGIGIGSTYAQVHKKYPDAETPSEELGRFFIPAPEAAVPAVYRIGLNTGAGFADSKVTEIALQAEQQACYE